MLAFSVKHHLKKMIIIIVISKISKIQTYFFKRLVAIPLTSHSEATSSWNSAGKS
jgi:hypothetical protein